MLVRLRLSHISRFEIPYKFSGTTFWRLKSITHKPIGVTGISFILNVSSPIFRSARVKKIIAQQREESVRNMHTNVRVLKVKMTRERVLMVFGRNVNKVSDIKQLGRIWDLQKLADVLEARAENNTPRIERFTRKSATSFRSPFCWKEAIGDWPNRKTWLNLNSAERQIIYKFIISDNVTTKKRFKSRRKKRKKKNQNNWKPQSPLIRPIFRKYFTNIKPSSNVSHWACSISRVRKFQQFKIG